MVTKAKVLPWRPLVIRVLAPLTTYSSPSLTALVSMAWTSLPALGSVMQIPPRFSPVAIRGRNRSFCSWVPPVATMYAIIKWELRTPLRLIQPRHISSTTKA